MSMIPVETTRRRLGRGLTALLGGGAPSATAVESRDLSELRMIAVDEITRNPWQPRKDFDAESLGELADSIREHGLLQPILVREYAGSMQLIAGERRWLAAQKAGLTTIPCRIVDVIDKTACEFALEENLKRKDLSDLEKAQAFRDYIQQFECSVEELAKQLSMSRSAVSNLMRLLDLTDPVQNALRTGKLSAGHARALLPLDAAGQLELCGRIQAESLTVRQVETAVRELLGRAKRSSGPTEEPRQIEPISQAEQLIQTDQFVQAEQTTEQHAADTMQFPIAAGEHIENSGSASPACELHHQTAWETERHAPSEFADGAAPSPEAYEQGDGDTGPNTIPMMAAVEQHQTNHVRDLQEQLRGLTGTLVEIRLTGKETGQIVIPFTSNAEFERLLGLLRQRAAA